MVGASKNFGKGVEEDEVLNLLFGEKFRVADDGVDGSKEELRIFKEAFFDARDGDADKDENAIVGSNCSASALTSCAGFAEKVKLLYTVEIDREKEANAAHGEKEECAVAKLATDKEKKANAEHGEKDEYVLTKSSASLNCGGPVLTNVSSLEQASEKTEMKLLSIVHPDEEKKGPEHTYETSVDLLAQDLIQSPLPCQPVESSCISSGLDHVAKYNYNCGVQSVRDVKTAGQSVTSPISQDSVASGVLAFPAIGAPYTPISIKHNLQEAVNLDIVTTGSKKQSSRVLKARLESYAHGLLLDAGWIIKDRSRGIRQKPGYHFFNPDGKGRLESLTNAWKACGEALLLTAPISLHDNIAREWTDASMFWRDMTDALGYIEKTAQGHENSLSLPHRWRLLDPFMAVIWIDRVYGTLQKGTAVKAVDSTTFILSESNEWVSMNEIAKQANSALGQPCLCSLGSTIAPVPQDSVAIEGSCNQQLPFVQAVVQCTCDKKRKETSKKSFVKRTGEGPLADERLQVESKDAVSQRKRFKKSASKSTSMRKGSELVLYSPNEHENICTIEHDSGTNVAINSMQRLLDSGDSPCAVTPGNNIPAIQSFSTIISPLGQNTDFGRDNKMVIPLYEDFGPSINENFNYAENNASTEATEAKQKRKSTGDRPTRRVHRKSKKISAIEEHVGNDLSVNREIHHNSTETSVFRMDVNTCDLERTNVLIKDSSVQCLERLENYEEQMDYCQHASTVELSAKKDTCDLTMLLEDAQSHNLSKEVKEQNISVKDEYKTKRLKSRTFTPKSYKKQKLGHQSKKALMQIHDREISADDDTIPKVSDSGNTTNVILANGASSNHHSKLKLRNDSGSEGKKKTGAKRGPKPKLKLTKDSINGDEPLLTALSKKKSRASRGKSSASKSHDKPKGKGKLKSGKGSCRLLPRGSGKVGERTMDEKRLILGARTVLGWMIKMGSVSLKDKIQFRNPEDNAVLKEGRVTREGILCSCCSNILSVSEFKAHAGFEQQRPPLSLFVHPDKPYTQCQLHAWSTEYKARKGRVEVMGAEEVDENDDTCALCGDDGDLVCCDNCPSTYHQSCLSAKELPEGNWYCPNCVCGVCGDVADRKEMNALDVFKCSQCGHKYHSICIKKSLPSNGQLGTINWFCGEHCQKVYHGFRSRVGMVNHIDDGLSWTVLRYSDVDQNAVSEQNVALIAECNVKLAIALTLMEECFVQMVDPSTGIDMIPHVLYNWGSKFARLNYEGFFSVILEKGDVLVSVASIRLHGVTVAEMPLIATCSEHRRQGMCRLLLNAIEMLLKSLKVKMLVITAIPSLVETWTSGFGFRPVDDQDKQQLANVNLMKFPDTILLKKNLNEDPVEGSGEDVDLHVRSYYGGLVEMMNTSSGKLFTENHQDDPDALCFFESIVDVPVKQIDDKQRDILNKYCESSQPTSWFLEQGDDNIRDCSVRTATFSSGGLSQSFVQEKGVSTQVLVPDAPTIAQSCFDSLTSLSVNGEDCSNPKNMKETSHKAIILSDDIDAISMRTGRVVPSRSDGDPIDAGMNSKFLLEKTVASQVPVMSNPNSCLHSSTPVCMNGNASYKSTIKENQDMVPTDMEEKTSQEAIILANDVDLMATQIERLVLVGGHEEQQILVDSSSEVICSGDKHIEFEPQFATASRELPSIPLCGRFRDGDLCPVGENTTQLTVTTKSETRVCLKDAEERHSSLGTSEAKGNGSCSSF